MKRVLTIGCLAVVAMGFIGCSDDPEEVKYYTTESSGPTPVLEGFNQLTVSLPNATVLSDGNEFLFTWETGDQISVYDPDGDWVADLVIDDATAATPTFTIDGDVRFDDDTRYVAVYPSRESDQVESYVDYVAVALAMSAEQTQVGSTFDHLKDESYLEVEFKGDDPIIFENKKVITSIAFEVAGGDNPAILNYDDGDSYSYALSFEEGTKSRADSGTSYAAYMMTNPVAASVEERVMTFVVEASDGTELVKTEIQTYEGVSSGALCTIDVDKGTVEVVEYGSDPDTDTDTEEDPDVDPDPDPDGGYSGNNEDLTPDDGSWVE